MPVVEVEVAPQDILAARVALTGTSGRPLSAVSVGTPHFSMHEFETLRTPFGGRPISAAHTFLRVDWPSDIGAAG